MTKKFKLCIVLFLLVFVSSNQEAHAYINPGTGSYLVQTIISGLLGFVYLFKKIILGIFSKFKFKKEETDNFNGE